MKVDEVSQDEARQGEGLRGLIEIARRSVPDQRRDAETIEPVSGEKGAVALLRRARERIDWTRIPGFQAKAEPAEEQSLLRMLIRRICLFVLLPTALVGVYLFLIASDQYIADAQFAVRGNVEPMGDVNVGEFTSLIQKHNSQDSFIVRDYILSQTMVEALDKSLHISKLFSRSEADFWARYSDPQPIEELTKYWREQIGVRIEAVSGIITLSVRAFTPQDALTINKEIISRSEALINTISRRAQADMVVHAQADAEKTAERLRAAHLALQTYRNRWGIIDPIKSAESILLQISSLRKDKFKAENDLQVLRGSNLDEKSRGIQVLVATVGAIDQQLKQLQDQLTTQGPATGGATNMAEALLQYEGLLVERTIAEKLNESSNTMLDRARVAASKQQIYLATFVPPVLPTDTLYPRRWRALLVTFFCCLVVWSSVSLVLSGIRDQRL